MRRVRPAAFPELRRVFSGYLHEDFASETGTPEAALREFRADAAPAERRRFKREVKRFLEHAATINFDEVRDLVYRLGSRWTPPSREALVKLLADAADLNDHPPIV